MIGEVFSLSISTSLSLSISLSISTSTSNSTSNRNRNSTTNSNSTSINVRTSTRTNLKFVIRSLGRDLILHQIVSNTGEFLKHRNQFVIRHSYIVLRTSYFVIRTSSPFSSKRIHIKNHLHAAVALLLAEGFYFLPQPAFGFAKRDFFFQLKEDLHMIFIADPRYLGKFGAEDA